MTNYRCNICEHSTIDTMLRIKQAIDDKKIEEEIRKILSPKFCYPINAIEDVKT